MHRIRGWVLHRLLAVRRTNNRQQVPQLPDRLQQHQLQDELEEIGKSATPELNEQYFGPSPTTSGPATGGRSGTGGRQPSTPPQ